MTLSLRCQKGRPTSWEARICVNEEIDRGWPHLRPWVEIEIGRKSLQLIHWEYQSKLPRCLINRENSYTLLKHLTMSEERGALRLWIRMHNAAPDRGNYTGTWNIRGVGAILARLQQFSALV